MSTITAYPAIFALPFVLIVIGIGLALVWIAERSPAAPLLQSCTGVVAPYGSLLSLLFGLFAAFLANDVLTHTDRARSSVSREADAIRVILTIADASGDRGRNLRTLALDYGKTTVGPDWRSAAPIAAAEMQSLGLLREVMFGGLTGADAEVRRTAIEAVTDIRTARRDRNSVADNTTAQLKWIAAFVLGVLTQMAIVVVQLGKPRSAVLAITLFSVGMAFTLWVILERIDPFAGRNPVPIAPIVLALKQ